MNDVPLVNKNDINSINTSIIAIKKQLMQLNKAVGLIDTPDVNIDLAPFVKKSDIVNTVQSGNLNPVTSNAVYQELNKSITNIGDVVTITNYTQNNLYEVPQDGFVVAVSNGGTVQHRTSILVQLENGTTEPFVIARTIVSGKSDKRCLFVRKGMKVGRDSSNDNITGNARLEFYPINS